MKVLFVTSKAPYGDLEIFSLMDIDALQSSGITVSILPRSPSGLVSHQVGMKLMDGTVSIRMLSAGMLAHFAVNCLRRPLKVLGLFVAAKRWSLNWIQFFKAILLIPKGLYVGQYLGNEGFTHVHSTSTTTTVFLAHVIAGELRVPWSLTAHALSEEMKRVSKQFVFVLQHAGFCRAISNRLANEIAALVPGAESRGRIHGLHFGVNLPLPSQASRNRMAAKDAVFTIATPAVLELRKGHFVALETAAWLKNNQLAFQWIFWGSGSLDAEIRERIRSLGLEHCVQALGPIPNEVLLEKYAKGIIDVVVLPSVDINGQPEGIPHALIQAMAHGIPCIASDSGAVSELITKDVGFLVKQGDSLALGRAVEQLLSNRELSRSLGTAAYRKVAAEFESAAIAREFGNLLMRPVGQGA